MNNHNDFEKLEIPLISILLKIYEKAHQFIFSLPKFERYSLGEKIENYILEAIELVIIGNGASKFDKEKILLRANSKIELIKILYRIALNCKMIDGKKYLELEVDLQEAGKQTQGWIKYARNMK
jgi:hypothetical protein